MGETPETLNNVQMNLRVPEIFFKASARPLEGFYATLLGGPVFRVHHWQIEKLSQRTCCRHVVAVRNSPVRHVERCAIRGESVS
jgi:hypothetical protein